MLTLSSTTDHLNTDFSTTCEKISRYSGELARQMADGFIALHYFYHGMFVYGVVKLSFSNKFFSDRWVPYVLICEHFHVQTSLGYQAIVLLGLHFFLANYIVFISTVGLSNEENCCQSQGKGKLIKKKLLKSIFRVD